MNRLERSAAPAIGASLGYFLALYLTAHVAWVPETGLPETVAFAGGICTYIVQEARNAIAWIAAYVRERR